MTTETANQRTESIGASVWRHPAVILATGFWFGRIPIMPGTFGALWGLPLAWGISLLGSVWIQLAVIGVVCGLGIPICTIAARRLGGKKDPQAIVLDEIASLPITFFLVPHDLLARPLTMIVGFALHR